MSDWNKGNWITWKLDTPGDYWIYVEAKTSSGQTATSVYGHRYKGRIVELGEMIVIDRGDHYDVGVNYKTNDTGLTFRWLVYDLQKKIWTTITDNTKSNWISHSFENVGYYWITVQAIDSDGNITSNTAGITYKGPQLNLNGICYLFQDNRIDVGVAYDCTDPNVEFQWMAYNLDTKTWELISEWNTGNWTSWTPEKGNYWLNIQARTSDGTTKNKTISFHVSRTYKFNISGISPVEYDDKIVLNAEYANGSNPVIFKWLIRDLNNSMWETLSDWTYQEYAVWNPEIGDYEICLQAADRTGNLKTYTINYHVTNNCAIPQPEATILRVGKAEEFTTINDAIINAIEIGVSENNPIRILIESGYYNEQIILDNIHGLSLEGEGCDNTIIEYAGSYPDCVIHASGDIQFSNLTIRETGSTYAVHVDPVNTGVGGRVVFSGCSIQGGACAIGYGSGIGTEVHLINCELMGSKYVIYAHNSPFSGTGQKLVINGCSFIQTSEMAVALFDDAAYSYFRSSSPMVIIASNNTYNGLTQGTIAFRKDTFSGEVLNYIPDNEDNILLSPDNGNNSNILGLDY